MPDKKVYLLGTDYLKVDFIRDGIETVEDDPKLVVVGFDKTTFFRKPLYYTFQYILNYIKLKD